MVVDDSPSMRRLTSKTVANAGWKVISAEDGLDALEMLHGSQRLPDLILTDVEMPRMNGYELIVSIKKNERLNQIPVVFITSLSDAKYRDKAVELGVSEYLSKPFDEAELTRVIKHLVKHSVPHEN
jgi:chemosensory pili system protein ChpA (sensor histidine kinase/response regulator)